MFHFFPEFFRDSQARHEHAVSLYCFEIHGLGNGTSAAYMLHTACLAYSTRFASSVQDDVGTMWCPVHHPPSKRILHLSELRNDFDRIRCACRFSRAAISCGHYFRWKIAYLASDVSSLMKTFHFFSSPIVDLPVVQESL